MTGFQATPLGDLRAEHLVAQHRWRRVLRLATTGATSVADTARPAQAQLVHREREHVGRAGYLSAWCHNDAGEPDAARAAYQQAMSWGMLS